MNLIKARYCLLVLLLAVSAVANAQYAVSSVRPFTQYLRDKSWYEIGVNYTMVSGTFNGVVPIYGLNNRFITDSTLKRSVQAEPGFGANLGIAVPIITTGHISNIALTFAVMYNTYKWKEINKAYNLDGTYKSLPDILNAKTTQLALPIGLDYKIGADAIASSRMRLGASFGVGVVPHYNSTALDKVSDLFVPQQSIGVNPYVKAEFGFRAGFFFKLRAMYNVGNVELLNMNNDPVPPYTHGPFKLTTNSQAIFSLIVLPFSNKWGEKGWWDMYDSYNWNERLN